MLFTKSDITIRNAHQEDMPKVCELVQELADYEKAPEEMWLKASDYVRYFEEGHFECLVAESATHVVGVMIYYPTFSTWKGPMLHLEDFIISEAYRRRGIGKIMMDAFLNMARDRGVNLVLWQVLDWNTPAINFYKRYETIFDKDWWNVKMLLKSKPVND